MPSQRKRRGKPDKIEASRKRWLNTILRGPGTEAEPQGLPQYAIPPPPAGKTVRDGIYASEIGKLLALERLVGEPFVSDNLKTVFKAAFETSLEDFRERFPDDSWMEQLVSLATKRDFKAWLHGSDSQFLVVRDEETVARKDTHSPLSYAVFALSDKKRRDEVVRPITFHCGQHLEQFGTQGSSRLIMRDITFQIMNYLGPKWLARDEKDTVDFRQRLEEKDPDSILSAFCMMEREMVYSTVYVFIDGLYHYQGGTYEEDAKKTIKCLYDLVNEMAPPQEPRIKVLITNPTREQQHSWGFEAATIEL
ncbi:hypothetical protein TgHK011_009454 [Trichoderma gracile]|nr:hypothetical protein TgHK011_009454 [Trichoderma gracile]